MVSSKLQRPFSQATALCSPTTASCAQVVPQTPPQCSLTCLPDMPPSLEESQSWLSHITIKTRTHACVNLPYRHTIVYEPRRLHEVRFLFDKIYLAILKLCIPSIRHIVCHSLYNYLCMWLKFASPHVVLI